MQHWKINTLPEISLAKHLLKFCQHFKYVHINTNNDQYTVIAILSLKLTYLLGIRTIVTGITLNEKECGAKIISRK